MFIDPSLVVDITRGIVKYIAQHEFNFSVQCVELVRLLKNLYWYEDEDKNIPVNAEIQSQPVAEQFLT